MSDTLQIGFIGIGQSGNNIVDTIAKDNDFPVIALNTAQTDLDALDHIPKDVRLCTKITNGGGAGKDIRVGARGIKAYSEKIIDQIRMNMGEVDHIFLVGGLGGGTGSLGILALSQLLNNKMEKEHSCICTIPNITEGTDRKKNAYIAMRELHKLHRKASKLYNIYFIDNNKLKERVLNTYESISHEQVWDRGNELISKPFESLYDYAHRTSKENFDPNDLLNCIEIKGCSKIASGKYKFNTDSTSSSLASKTKELWEDSLFLTGDIDNTQNALVIIERPAAEDAHQMDKLEKEIKSEIENNVDVVPYQNNDLEDEEYPLRIFIMLSGLTFPLNRIHSMEESVEEELNKLEEKKEKTREENFNLDMKFVTETMEEKSQSEEAEEEELGFEYVDFLDDEEDDIVEEVKFENQKEKENDNGILFG